MRFNLRRFGLIGTLAMVTALVVAACGGGGDPTAEPGAPQPQAPLPTATAAPTATLETAATAGPAPTQAPQPQALPTSTPRATAGPTVKRGGTLTLPQFHDLVTFDASNTRLYMGYYLNGHFLWNQVVTFDNKRWSDSDVVGDLATEWSINDDGTVWTFKLDPAARWQNIAPLNGRNMTAADIKWYFEYVLDPDNNSGIGGIIRDIETIEAPDDNTIVFNLKAPFSGFLRSLANSRVKVLPRENLEVNGDFETPIGTGPFVHNRHERGARVIHDANPNYWKIGADGQALPYIDRIEFIIGADSVTVEAGLRTGKLGFITPGGMDPQVARDFMEDNPQLDWIIDFKLYAPVVFTNFKVEPWKSNRDLRLAIMRAINQDAIRSNVIFEDGAPLEGPITAGMGEFSLPQDELKELLRYDLDEAKALVISSGVGGDDLKVRLQFMLAGAPGSQTERYGLVIPPMLEAAGFDVQLNMPASAAQGYGAIYGGNFEIGSGFVGFEGDINNWFRSFYSTTGDRNRPGLSDATLDAMIAEFDATLDHDLQVTKAHEIQRYILEQAYYVPLVAGSMYIPQQKYVKDFIRTWSWGFSKIEFVWLDL